MQKVHPKDVLQHELPNAITRRFIERACGEKAAHAKHHIFASIAPREARVQVFCVQDAMDYIMRLDGNIEQLLPVLCVVSSKCVEEQHVIKPRITETLVRWSW